MPDDDFLPQSEGWMMPSDLQRLRDAALVTKGLPGGLLELGVWKGLSTSALTLAGPVVCVDDFRGNPNEPYDVSVDFERNLRGLGRWDRVKLLRLSTIEGLRRLRNEGSLFRLILVDASHAEQDVYEDLRGAWPLLVHGGYLFLDDADWESVDRARQRFEEEQHVQFEGLHRAVKLVQLVKG